MTVEEFMNLNQNITDLYIEVREAGSKLVDYLAIGPDAGIKPRYPIGLSDRATKKEGTYLRKNINAWDDGSDYWKSKPNKLPKGWKDLEIIAFNSVPILFSNHHRSASHPSRSYECYRLWVLPSGEYLEKEPPKEEVQLPGQTSIFDFINEVSAKA